MTNITRLTQEMKAAAEKAKHAGEAPIMPFDVRVSALNEYQITVCPDNVLALVEALEKAQTKAHVYDMLRDDYGLREKGIGLTDFVDWQANRIVELESRTVKLPHRNLGHDKLFILCPFPYYDSEDMEKALTDAGVKWKREL